MIAYGHAVVKGGSEQRLAFNARPSAGSQHDLEGVPLVVDGHVEGLMDLLEWEVMRVQGCGIVAVTDSKIMTETFGVSEASKVFCASA